MNPLLIYSQGAVGLDRFLRMFDGVRGGSGSSHPQADEWTALRSDQERIRRLLSDLRRTQEMLSSKQDELLQAVLLDDTKSGGLRQEVHALSVKVMSIVDQVEEGLRRPRWHE